MQPTSNLPPQTESNPIIHQRAKTIWKPGDPGLLLDRQLTPMDAASALYHEDRGDLPEAIVASISRRVFEGDLPSASGRFRRGAAVILRRVLHRTTRSEVKVDPDGNEIIVYRNRILEKSDHPYAETLLETSGGDGESFVEGGDPMNGPYMMISPEIRQNSGTWDKILLDSVLGADVQLRFALETRMTYQFAKERLEQGKSVDLKAAAGGTGLSMILAFDRLIRAGYDPNLISATITDRSAANVARATRLLETLETTRNHLRVEGGREGIAARTEDLLNPIHHGAGGSMDSGSDEAHQVLTLVGILEYFHGYTSATTEEHLGISAENEQACAVEMIRRVAASSSKSCTLITNSYRGVAGARFLEVFGKRFRYRSHKDLLDLVGTAGFVPTGHHGSGNVYDVVAFEKRP